MSTARFIVDTLLENDLVRACAACEKETGQKTPNASHGYCKRHLIEMQKQVVKAAVERGNMDFARQAQQKIATIQQRPDSDFPPDLAQQRQAAQPA